MSACCLIVTFVNNELEPDGRIVVGRRTQVSTDINASDRATDNLRVNKFDFQNFN